MDTMSVQDTLISSGFESQQAKGIVKAIEMASDRHATRQDLRELELKLKLFAVMNSMAIIGILSAIKYFG